MQKVLWSNSKVLQVIIKIVHWDFEGDSAVINLNLSEAVSDKVGYHEEII